MRMAKGKEAMTERPLPFYRIGVVLLVLSTLVLLGCNALNTLMPERAVKNMFDALPQPEGIVLIDEVTRGTHGSDERCIGASSYRLYGTEQSFEQVMAFYEERLPGGAWHKVEEDSPPTVWASPTKHFTLVVSSNVEATLIPPEAIDHGRARFSTLYYVALSYVNNPDYCRAF